MQRTRFRVILEGGESLFRCYCVFFSEMLCLVFHISCHVSFFRNYNDVLQLSPNISTM